MSILRGRVIQLLGCVAVVLFAGCGGGGGSGVTPPPPDGDQGGEDIQPIVATGVLDADFDGDGMTFFDFTMGNDFGKGVAIQPDGKIVIAGDVDNAQTGTFELAVVRFNGDGSLDTSFDGDGVASTGTGGSARGNAVALQPDGKIVVAGTRTAVDRDVVVVRFNPDGSVDSTFDGDGIATTSLGEDQEANGVAIQSDGKIVAVGRTGGAPVNNDTLIIRYNADGSIDAGFGTNGVVTTPVSPGDFDGAFSVAIQSDGKIVTAGQAGGLVSVLRYNGDGTLDTGFDTDGIVTTSVTGNTDSGNAVALQADGKIVVCGLMGAGGNADVGVIRYNADGSLDLSFNGTGIVTTNVLGIDRGNAIALQSNGQIVVAADAGDDDQFAVLRYNADGSLDLNFDEDGVVTTPVGAGSNRVSGVAIQPDGRIVVVGTAQDPANVSLDIAVVRYE